jgi:hypothetical protein
MACRHTSTVESEPTGYTGPVYTPGWTEEERRAHGAITFTETCVHCYRTRRVNANGRHVEHSKWEG